MLLLEQWSMKQYSYSFCQAHPGSAATSRLKWLADPVSSWSGEEWLHCVAGAGLTQQHWVHALTNPIIEPTVSGWRWQGSANFVSRAEINRSVFVQYLQHIFSFSSRPCTEYPADISHSSLYQGWVYLIYATDEGRTSFHSLRPRTHMQSHSASLLAQLDNLC